MVNDSRVKKDYIDKFELMVENLFEASIYPSQEDRNRLVDRVCNEYFEVVGQFPNVYLLDKLADYILIDDLKDNHPDKVTRCNYPILSDRQMARRKGKNFSAEEMTLNFLNSKVIKNMDSLKKKPKDIKE